MGTKHYRYPEEFNPPAGNIGELPSGELIGRPLVRQWNYLRNWLQGMQIFTYSGPGAIAADWNNKEYNPPYNYDCSDACYDIILHHAPKTDTSNPARQLYGAILAWQVAPYHNRMLDMTTIPATVTWDAVRASGESAYEQTIYATNSSSTNWHSACAFKAINADDGACLINLFNFDTGANLLHDGFCNLPHTFAWGKGNDALVTKETSYPTPASGTYALKVAYDGTTNPYATVGVAPGAHIVQTKTGRNYIFIGKCCGDLSAYPSIVNGATTLKTGGASSAWQDFALSFTAEADEIKLVCNTSSAGYCGFDAMTLEEQGTFQYLPDTDGEWSLGQLRTNRMRVAALGIWQCPDRILTDNQAIIRPGNVSAGRAIRGYLGSDDPSMGTLIHRLGRGWDATFDNDDVERATRRCILGFGHPLGIGTTSASPVNIRAGKDSSFLVEARNLRNKSGTSAVRCYPAVSAYTEGASGGNPGYVRIYADNGGSTSDWTATITDDANGGLQTNIGDEFYVASGIDKIEMTIEAPTGGAIWLKSATIWEGGCDE